MPSPRPRYLPGHYYHFFNRGSHKQSIFREPDNYLFVLRKLKKYSISLKIKIIAYCLMPNHYHFLVRQDGMLAAGLLPQRVFNSYSKSYNLRYSHTGTLFEGNYKVQQIENKPYLQNLCVYIHANPVHHGIVSDPADWPYSNYLEWIGQREGTLFDKDFVQSNYPIGEKYSIVVLKNLRKRIDLPIILFTKT